VGGAEWLRYVESYGFCGTVFPTCAPAAGVTGFLRPVPIKDWVQKIPVKVVDAGWVVDSLVC